MNRIKLGIIGVVSTLVFSGCIPYHFDSPYWFSDYPGATAVTYPEGNPTDWYWQGINDDMAKHIRTSSGSIEVWVKACFPASETWEREYVYYVDHGIEYMNTTYEAGCTAWNQLTYADNSLGWRKLAEMAGGETFTSKLRLIANYSTEDFDAAAGARVANWDQSIVYHDF